MLIYSVEFNRLNHISKSDYYVLQRKHRLNGSNMGGIFNDIYY